MKKIFATAVAVALFLISAYIAPLSVYAISPCVDGCIFSMKLFPFLLFLSLLMPSFFFSFSAILIIEKLVFFKTSQIKSYGKKILAYLIIYILVMFIIFSIGFISPNPALELLHFLRA